MNLVTVVHRRGNSTSYSTIGCDLSRRNHCRDEPTDILRHRQSHNKCAITSLLCTILVSLLSK